MQVTFPTGRAIGPGFHQIHTTRTEEEEVWWMGNLIEIKIHVINEVHGVEVPDPGEEADWPLRGEFTFADHTWLVVRDDDQDFWGAFSNGRPKSKQDFLAEIQAVNAALVNHWADAGWWDIGPNGEPQKKAKRFSIAAMALDNKVLMAHLMVDLGFFPSVGQAKKNGWDKPLELGRHELGPKKKREFVEIVP